VTAICRLARAVSGLAGIRRAAAAAALGVAAVLALPPLHILPLVALSFTGLLWLLDGARTRFSAFLTGWWFGFGYFAAGLYWIANALLTDAARWGWLVPIAVPGIAAGLALFPAAAGLAARLLCRRGRGRVVALAVAWTAFEWLRGQVLTGFPWNPVGSVWEFSDATIQSAALFGITGLGLLTVLIAAAPATLADKGSLRRRILPLAAALALVAVLWAGGAVRLAGAGTEEVAAVRLRLVQANITQSHKWQRELMERHLERYVTLSRRPVASPALAPTVVLWPETAAAFSLGDNSAGRKLVASVTPPGGLLITGAPRVEKDPGHGLRIWNSLLAVTDSGAIVGVYDKFHLVPFGEYVPLRGLLPLSKITAGGTDFSAGPGPRTLRLPGLPPVSPLICYEVIFPGAVLDADDRPQWLLNITNDAWFGISTGPYQHFAAARMRAVEEGLPLVRVANTGISAVVDAYGRIMARLDLGVTGILDAALPKPLSGLTPYARFGDLPILLLLFAAAAVLLRTGRR
jgi:apolipoprotein N-acyltransferase